MDRSDRPQREGDLWTHETRLTLVPLARLLPAVAARLPRACPASTCNIDFTQPQQRIDGFGAFHGVVHRLAATPRRRTPDHLDTFSARPWNRTLHRAESYSALD